jgi:penicillin-binding protein 2
MKDFSRLKVKNNFRDSLEPHEVFLDRLAQEKEREIPESENKMEKPLPEKKLWLLFVFSLTVFVFLSGVTFWLQFIEGEEYVVQARNNQFVVRSIRAERGVIYDIAMNQLVQNQAVHRLIVEPGKLPINSRQKNLLIERVANFIGISSEELFDKIDQSSAGKIVVARNLNYDQVIVWETKSENGLGFSLEREIVRQYSGAGTLAHVLGYVSRTDQKGSAGLEGYYDKLLRDRSGKKQTERDARGKIIEDVIIEDPEPGDSLVLNIDYDLQIIMEQALRSKMEEVGSREANAVAIDPRNGAVRALVSIPGYDNNIFSQLMTSEEIKERMDNPNFSLFNQAISGIGYATGSVIKPLIAIAALEENIIDPNREIFAPAEICVSHAYTGEQQCYRDWKFHGMTDMRRAIAESVNTYFYMIGGGHQEITGLGANRIKDWLTRFGWDKLTGIDLPNEGAGVLPNIDQNWRLGNTYHLSIGQGSFSATPMQVASAYVAIANGGTLYRPQIVSRVIRQINGEKILIEQKEPEIITRSVASYENIRIVQEGMRQAVTSPQSSTYAMNSLLVNSAVKTGTAQTGRDRVYHNWIALFAPYEEPEIVMVFMIKDVKESMIAVRSVAQDVLRLYFDDKDDKFN